MGQWSGSLSSNMHIYIYDLLLQMHAYSDTAYTWKTSVYNTLIVNTKLTNNSLTQGHLSHFVQSAQNWTLEREISGFTKQSM